MVTRYGGAITAFGGVDVVDAAGAGVSDGDSDSSGAEVGARQARRRRPG